MSNIAEQHQYFVTFQQPYWEFDQDADFKKLISYISTGIIIQWWAQILVLRNAKSTPPPPPAPPHFPQQSTWLEHYSLEYRPLYYWRYVDDTFVLFDSTEHLKCFRSYLNFCHLNISFTIENEKDNRVSFVNVNIIRAYNPQTNF